MIPSNEDKRKVLRFYKLLVFPAVITRRPQLLIKIIQLYFPDIIIGEMRTEKTHPENFAPMLKQKSVRMDIKTADSEERRIIAEMIAYEDGQLRSGSRITSLPIMSTSASAVKCTGKRKQ